jgi:hypothetical protein
MKEAKLLRDPTEQDYRLTGNEVIRAGRNKKTLLSQGFILMRVNDGARTRDLQNHNLAF